MVNPQLVPEGALGGVLPRYRPIGALKAGTLRKVIAGALSGWCDGGDALPGAILSRHAFPGCAEALHTIHRPAPADLERIGRMKERFHLQRVPFFPAGAAVSSATRSPAAAAGTATASATPCAAPSTAACPSGSAAQEQAFSSVVNDLLAPSYMQRTPCRRGWQRQTIVAFLALLMAMENGFQGAFLARPRSWPASTSRTQAFFRRPGVAC